MKTEAIRMINKYTTTYIIYKTQDEEIGLLEAGTGCITHIDEVLSGKRHVVRYYLDDEELDTIEERIELQEKDLGSIWSIYQTMLFPGIDADYHGIIQSYRLRDIQTFGRYMIINTYEGNEIITPHNNRETLKYSLGYIRSMIKKCGVNIVNELSDNKSLRPGSIVTISREGCCINEGRYQVEDIRLIPFEKRIQGFETYLYDNFHLIKAKYEA